MLIALGAPSNGLRFIPKHFRPRICINCFHCFERFESEYLDSFSGYTFGEYGMRSGDRSQNALKSVSYILILGGVTVNIKVLDLIVLFWRGGGKGVKAVMQNEMRVEEVTVFFA